MVGFKQSVLALQVIAPPFLNLNRSNGVHEHHARAPYTHTQSAIHCSRCAVIAGAFKNNDSVACQASVLTCRAHSFL